MKGLSRDVSLEMYTYVYIYRYTQALRALGVITFEGRGGGGGGGGDMSVYTYTYIYIYICMQHTHAHVIYVYIYIYMYACIVTHLLLKPTSPPITTALALYFITRWQVQKTVPAAMNSGFAFKIILLYSTQKNHKSETRKMDPFQIDSSRKF